MQLTPRDKRMLQILGAVAAVAIVFLFVTNVLGGGGEDVAAPTGPTGGVTGPTAAPSVSPSPTPRETLPPVVLAGARDPFSIPPGLATTSGSVAPTTGDTGTGTTTGGGGTTTFTTQPPVITTSTFTSGTTTLTTTITGTTTGTTTTTTTTGGPEAPNSIKIGGHDVKIRFVDTRHNVVQVKVDRKLYTVERGATFDENFMLVSVDGKCAKFLFGDQSFTLCKKGKH